MIKARFNNKLSKYLFLPLPLLLILLFSYYVTPWISLRRFDEKRNSGCIATIISANKKENLNVVLIGSSRFRRGFDPQIINNKLLNEKGKSINLGSPGRSYYRAFSLLDNIYSMGLRPEYVVIGLNTPHLYYDSLENISENINSEKYLKNFIEKYFIDIYGIGTTKDIKIAKKQIKRIINKQYFSIDGRYSKRNFNINLRITKLKNWTSNLRHPFSRTLFLNEPKLYSESFNLPRYLTSFITAQRFLYVLNRSVGESYIYLAQKLLNTVLFKDDDFRGLWLGDVCWRDDYGSRATAIGIENLQIKPFINEGNRENLNKEDLKKIKKSWDKLQKLKNIQYSKNNSEYSAEVNAKSFSFGIPGLNYENADLGKSLNTLLDLQLMDEIRKLTQKYNSKLIITRLPRIYDRYPSKRELTKIKELYPEFIYPSEAFFENLNKIDNFADIRHFNLYGRYLYSEWLAKEILSL